jgi:soluble lytic murein transglycosylase-like protein
MEQNTPLKRLGKFRILLSLSLPLTLLAESSIERQVASARRQTKADATSTEFFTVPWLKPASALPPAVPSNEAGATPQAASLFDCEPLSSELLQDIVTESAKQEGVDENLIHAIIARESAGRPCAVSVKGAQGLMQLMPATQGDLQVSDAFDPVDNVRGGTKYVAQLLKRYNNDLKLTLAAFNAGPRRVDDKIPEIAETQNYVAAIMASLEARKK